MDPDHRAALRTIATDFLDGRMLPLETASALATLEDGAPGDLRALMTTMVAVASETDDIPLGARRELWHRDVRVREDQKHNEAQHRAEPMVREACEHLLRRL
jgi:hypothetical protein